MATATDPDQSVGRRRLPTQARSRERVERILDAASAMVLADGLDALTTRSIAERAEVPVASLYQYFSDRDAVLLAICERDMGEMDEQVASDLAALEVVSVRALVETAMRAFMKVYRQRPAFMQIWMRGRTNAAVDAFGRSHNRSIAHGLLELARADGLIEPGTLTDAQMVEVAEMAVELGDRAFQLAFEHDVRGNDLLLNESIELVSGYLSRFATTAGIEGVRR